MTRGVGGKRANEEQTSRGGEERNAAAPPLPASCLFPYRPAATWKTKNTAAERAKEREILEQSNFLPAWKTADPFSSMEAGRL